MQSTTLGSVSPFLTLLDVSLSLGRLSPSVCEMNFLLVKQNIREYFINVCPSFWDEPWPGYFILQAARCSFSRLVKPTFVRPEDCSRLSAEDT